jgi:hypothetical protein
MIDGDKITHRHSASRKHSWFWDTNIDLAEAQEAQDFIDTLDEREYSLLKLLLSDVRTATYWDADEEIWDMASEILD